MPLNIAKQASLRSPLGLYWHPCGSDVGVFAVEACSEASPRIRDLHLQPRLSLSVYSVPAFAQLLGTECGDGSKAKSLHWDSQAMLIIGVAVWIQVATGSPAVTAVGFALAGLLGSYFGWRWSRKKSAEVEGYRQELIGKRPIEDLRSDGQDDLDE